MDQRNGKESTFSFLERLGIQIHVERAQFGLLVLLMDLVVLVGDTICSFKKLTYSGKGAYDGFYNV